MYIHERQSQKDINGWWKGGLVSDPEAGISLPQDNGEALEEVSGGLSGKEAYLWPCRRPMEQCNIRLHGPYFFPP